MTLLPGLLLEEWSHSQRGVGLMNFWSGNRVQRHFKCYQLGWRPHVIVLQFLPLVSYDSCGRCHSNCCCDHSTSFTYSSEVVFQIVIELSPSNSGLPCFLSVIYRSQQHHPHHYFSWHQLPPGNSLSMNELCFHSSQHQNPSKNDIQQLGYQTQLCNLHLLFGREL